MKRFPPVLYTAAIFIIIGLIWFNIPAAGSQTQSSVLGINEFMKNVDLYRGKVRLEGVVSAVSSADQSLSVIDVQEFKDCGVTTCAPLTLPVKWPGPLPVVEDVVQLEGEVRESNGKLFFQAQRLQKKGSK